MKRITLHNTALFFAILPLLVIGCKGETTTPEVEIIEVRVSPGEVQAGYISELVCVFSDSMSDGYEFRWEISGVSGGRLDTTTSVNTLFVKSSSEEGVYNNSVQVFREEEEITPRFDFTLTVVERNWKPEDPFYEDADLIFERLSGDPGISLFNTKTGEERKIRNQGGGARWSPEGDRVLFSASHPDAFNPTIYMSYADGSGERIVALEEGPNGLESTWYSTSRPVWSPDGRSFAYAKCYGCEGALNNREILITELDISSGYHEKRITRNNYADRPIDWFPDGSILLISSSETLTHSEGHFADIYTINIDGTGKKKVFDFREQNAGRPRLSPNGKFIAFTYGQDQEIYISNADGTDIKRITNNEYLEDYVSWLPDGSGLVFVMDYNIYTISIDGSDLKQITSKKDQYAYPVWRPNRN